MGDPKSKAAKRAKDSVPWAAVIVAVLGWYDARGTGQDAASKATKVAQVAKDESTTISNARLRDAYQSVQDTFAAHDQAMVAHAQRLEDLENWVVELEEWVEDEIEQDSPRTRADREAREERLTAIRDRKRKRRLEKAAGAFHSGHPEPAKLPDFDQMQTKAALDPILDLAR